VKLSATENKRQFLCDNEGKIIKSTPFKVNIEKESQYVLYILERQNLTP
jgi:hypothetical protein